MDSKENFDDFKKNKIYLLRYIYMIRKNLPTNSIFYLAMFILNYIGAIVCSRIPEISINSKFFSVNQFLSSILIFGKNFKTIQNNYEFYCIFGALILLIYCIFCLICFYYMKSKYIKISSLKDYEMQNIEKNHKFENIIFKIISYIFIIIIFFRQYILEYYFFAIYSVFFYREEESSEYDFDINTSKYNENSYKQIYSYFSMYNCIICFIINIIVIVLIIIFFIAFMLLNSTKGLFLSYGYPFSDNKKYIAMKIILVNLQPFYGITIIFNEDTKNDIAIIFNSLLIIFCLFSFYNCFHQFGFYPSLVTNTCLFMEFFIFVSSISQLVIYFIGLKCNSNAFILIRLCIEIIDTVFLMYLFISKSNEYNLNLFSSNIFSTNFTCISKGGFYYYMKMYKIYEKNKNKNYSQIFKIIIKHINNCNKIDCPEKKLIPKNISESMYLPVLIQENERSLLKYHLNENFDNDLSSDLNTSNSTKSVEDEHNIFCNYNKSEEKILKNENSLKKYDNQKNFNCLKEENKNIRNDFDLNPSIINEKYKLSDKQFQIIFEQEIINRIDYLNKRRKYYYLEDYIFIHLQYLLQIKKNYSLTLYYVGKYSSSGIKWSFYTRYFLYEYKKYIISIYYNKTNLTEIDEIANKHRKENHFLREVIFYFNYCTLFRHLIVNSCENLKILFSLRRDLHNNLTLKSYQRIKTKNVLKSAENLQKCIDNIGIVLKNYHIKYHIKLISPEISYLISNYYIFIMNKIPFDIKQYMEIKLDFISILEQLDAGYKFFHLLHPFVIALTKNDTFSIIYLSNVICAKLGYVSTELLNKDFHEKLFPGYKFIKEHELLMKQFLFCDCNTIKRSNTFLKTKDGYLMGVKLKLKKFPTFLDSFLYIVDIKFNDDFYDSEINKSFNRYSFLLDDSFDFMYITKNFYEEFEFNVEMFKDLHMNFFDFFCIDQNKIYKKIKELGKNNPLLTKGTTNKINLIKKNDAFTIFKNINYENVFELRNICKFEDITFKSIIFQDKIDKNKIIKSLAYFSKLIEEYGLDCEWYKHIDNFKQRLLVKDIIEEEDIYEETMESSLTKNENAKNSLIYNSSPGNNNDYKKNNNFFANFNLENVKIQNPNCLSSNLVAIVDKNFESNYTLKRICNIRYCIVDLREKTDYMDCENKNEFIENNEDKNETQKLFLKKNNNYKKFIKDGRLTIKKAITPKNLSIIESHDILKKNTLYESNDFKLSPNNKYKISRTKSQFSKKQNLLRTKFINNNSNDNNNIEPVEKKSELQNEKEKNKKKRQTEIFFIQPLSDEKKKNSNIESEVNSNNKNIQIKNCNDLLQEGSETSNINNLNIYNAKIGEIISNKNINKDNKKIKDRKSVSRNRNSTEMNEKYINSYNMLNSTTNSNIKKQNNEDEEKTSFINQDELEDYIKNIKNKSIIYIIIIAILCLLLFIFPTIKVIILIINFSKNENLITLMSTFEIIKMDLYSSAYILMGECANTTKNEDATQSQIQFQNLNNIMSEHIATLLNQFQIINNNKNIDNIILYIYSNIETFELNNDWSLKLRNTSNFIRELNYLEYIFKKLSYVEDMYTECGLEKTYFQVFTRLSDDIYNDVGEPTLTQKFLYYIMRNYMFSFKTKFSQIDDEMCNAQLKILINYFRSALEISICFCILLIFGFIIVLLKSKLDMKFTIKIFLFFYHYERKHLQFEYEIYYLEKVTKEFNIDNIYLLENIKKYDQYYLFIINLEKNKIKNFPDKNINEIKKNDNYKNKRNINFKDTNKFSTEQKSMSSFLINQSIASNSNSMIQFLNNKNNSSVNNLNSDSNNIQNNLNLKNTNTPLHINNNSLININNQNISEDEKLLKENEDSIFIIKTNKKIIPNSIIISIWLPLIGIILLISFTIYNTIESSMNNNAWKYSFYLSMNYFQRIPRVMELGMYIYFIVMSGNLDLVEYDTKKDYLEKMPIFMSYFTKLKGYDNSELISSDFIDSYFTNILLDNLRIKKNIEFSLQKSKYKNYFTEYTSFNQKLNDEGYFCYNAAIGSIKLSNPKITSLNFFFELVNDLAESCFEGNEEIEETGLNLELNYIYQELTNAFTDFLNSDNKTEARKKFYANKDIKRIVNDMNLPFQYAFNGLTFSVIKDMSKISKIIIKDEVFNIIITYVLSLFFIIFVIMFMCLAEKDKKLLEFLAKILKRN